jgi:hypothetical protein
MSSWVFAVVRYRRGSTTEPLFTELKRVRTHRNREKSGRFRWYNNYALPEPTAAP